MSELSLLSGEKRKWHFRTVTSASDPKRKLGPEPRRPLQLLPYGSNRQDNFKYRPVGAVRKRPKSPAVGLDDRLANRKPNTGPGGLRGEERLEDTVLVLLTYSGAGVCNGDHHIVRVANDS
jgi:hypothetical protein